MGMAGWVLLVAFAATVLLAAMSLLTAAGHFPRDGRVASLTTPAGRLLLWGAMTVAAAASAAAVVAAARLLPWPYVIVAAGLALLMAPLALQSFPDSVVDGRRGLVLFGGATALLAVATALLA